MTPAKTLAICILIISAALSAAVQKADAQNEAIGRAQTLLKAGDAAAAIGVLQSAIEKSPQDAALKFWLGRAFYATGNYRNAIENLTFAAAKLPKTSPDLPQAEQMLGLSYYISGQLAEAIPFMEKILSKQPENGEIAYALGVCYIQTRQPAKSRETFARLFRVPTNSAAAHLLNARMLVRQKFEETAEVELNEALKLDPKLPEVRFILGELAIYRAEIDKGIALLQQEIALNPANAMAYYRLGEGLSRQLKWDEAIPPLQRSIWINPFFSGPYIVLGKVYLKKQDLGNAESLLRRATAMDPKNFGARYLLGQVLQQAGKTEEAKAELALAEKLRGSGETEP